MKCRGRPNEKFDGVTTSAFLFDAVKVVAAFISTESTSLIFINSLSLTLPSIQVTYLLYQILQQIRCITLFIYWSKSFKLVEINMKSS